ncbi:MAG: ester cyclase [Acidimicrobiia bacterium]|nr:ester cyclase [Acidimicrobiia bacterium]
MSRADNRALLMSYMTEVWERGDPEAVALFADEDFRRHQSPTAGPLDRASQIERLKGFRQAFPDMTIEVEDVVVTDDRIAFRSTLRGTHLGPFMGIPATGRQVEVGLLDLIRIENGRFAEQWGGPDVYDLLTQLGATVTV